MPNATARYVAAFCPHRGVVDRQMTSNHSEFNSDKYVRFLKAYQGSTRYCTCNLSLDRLIMGYGLDMYRSD